MTTGVGVALVCPRCRARLSEHGEELRCEGCAAAYPVVEGIPDLRVAPDPWIGLEEDRAKARRVLEISEGQDFERTVRAYWSITPGTPLELARRFTDHVLGTARARSEEWLRAAGEDAAPGTDPWLDLGCGTADLGAAAGPHVRVVGVDVAMRWLVVARKRLAEQGLPSFLVCANAEALPFEDGAFGRVFALGLLEHCSDSGAVLAESRRVLARGGVLRLRTVNRYSLLPEPHVGLMGVGWMPRSLARAYVRWRTGQGYEHHHPLGRGGLARGLRGVGYSRVRVTAAPTLQAEAERMSGPARKLVPLYEWSRRTPALGRVVDRVAPLLEARGVAP